MLATLLKRPYRIRIHMTKRDTVAGLEMYCNALGANERAKFFWQECGNGFEIVMDFRGIRRFAFCTHKNDAEIIVETLNNRNKPMITRNDDNSFKCYTNGGELLFKKTSDGVYSGPIYEEIKAQVIRGLSDLSSKESDNA